MRTMRRALAVALLAISVACGQNDPQPLGASGNHGSPPPSTYTTPSSGVTAEQVVDAVGADFVNRFCKAYGVLGDYDTALAEFDRTYDQDDPSAREVVDEILSRC